MEETMRFLLALLIVASLPAAAAERLPVKEGQKYAVAREAIIDSGFRPAGHKGAVPGYPEMGRCFRDGMCLMLWRRNGMMLEVGEHLGLVETLRTCPGKCTGAPPLPSGLFGDNPRAAENRARAKALLGQ